MKKLERIEMKNLKGGRVYQVNCTAMPGYTQVSPGSCTGSASWCQQQTAEWCSAATHCQSCTVAGATVS